MIEAINMISHIQMIFYMASLGSLSYAIGFLSRLAHSWMKHRHAIKRLKLRLNFDEEVKAMEDVQASRLYRFPAGRSIITLSVFVLFSILLFTNNATGHLTAIPVEHSTSVLWGLFHQTGVKIEQIKAYYYDPYAFYTQTTMLIGFYFGQRVD